MNLCSCISYSIPPQTEGAPCPMEEPIAWLENDFFWIGSEKKHVVQLLLHTMLERTLGSLRPETGVVVSEVASHHNLREKELSALLSGRTQKILFIRITHFL